MCVRGGIPLYPSQIIRFLLISCQEYQIFHISIQNFNTTYHKANKAIVENNLHKKYYMFSNTPAHYKKQQSSNKTHRFNAMSICYSFHILPSKVPLFFIMQCKNLDCFLQNLLFTAIDQYIYIYISMGNLRKIFAGNIFPATTEI